MDINNLWRLLSIIINNSSAAKGGAAIFRFAPNLLSTPDGASPASPHATSALMRLGKPSGMPHRATKLPVSANVVVCG